MAQVSSGCLCCYFEVYYRQNIREFFYNYKNAVNVSKDLYTKVVEMLVQFEKKHDADYFYSNYFSTIVKES